MTMTMKMKMEDAKEWELFIRCDNPNRKYQDSE